MKKTKTILAIFLAALMLISLIGCGTKNDDAATDNETSAAASTEAVADTAGSADTAAAEAEEVAPGDPVWNEGDAKYKAEVEKAKGQQVTILVTYQPDGIFYADFEKKHGMKVNHVTCYAPMVPSKLAVMINSGDAPDVVPSMDFTMPSTVIKKLVQPLENYLDISCVLFRISDMDQFKMDDHYYAATSGVGPYLLFYNKTMFENNGVKTPAEYYEEGNWTFENFRKAAMELTQDTNDDGKTDQWGYCTNLEGFEFVSRNGGSFVEYDTTSSIKLTLEEPQTVEALQLFQDGYFKDKFIMINGENSYTTDFEAGKIAMTVSPDWIVEALIKPNMKDEWGFTSLPVGPKGDPEVQPSSWFGWSIPTGAKNPYGGGAWITHNYQYGTAKGNERGPKVYHGMTLTDEQLALYKELEKKVVYNKASGIGKWTDVFLEFGIEVKAGKTLSSLIAKYKPQLQTEIDNTINDTKTTE